MTPELTALTLAALLQVVQFFLMAIPANLEVKPGKTMSPRDGVKLEDEVSPRTARLVRAMNNHFEGLILFGIAVFVITFSDQANNKTALASYAYLVARILYVPAYAFGWTPWRSLIWAIGFCATIYLLVMALL
ncbi:MAG: MAPEG family protein [Marinovum sp.]|nr:MAPEG family protein [Marinovum sp.]